MKKSFIYLLLLVLTVGCKLEDTVQPPIIEELELGYQNSGTVMAGGDLHFDAVIFAEGRVDVVRIEIALKEDLPSNNHFEWKADTLYFKYKGLLNADIHEHLEVPQATVPGTYTFKISIVDLFGQLSALNRSFEVTPFDPDHDDDDDDH